MSLRKKDFERAIRKAGSNPDIAIRYRSLGNISLKYLRRFPDIAIPFVEKTILNKRDKNGEVPKGLETTFVEAAKYYSRNENYDRAEELLSQVVDSRNMTACLQARYEMDLIKIKRSLEQGKIDEKVIEDITEVVKNDEEHELETSEIGKFTDYDIFRSYFSEKIPVNELNEKIFPPRMKRPTGERIPSDHPSSRKKYVEGLSANNRLNFLVENFPISSGSSGEGKFKGAILFEIENSDLVIVEYFWKQTKNKEFVEDYGNATYILPKDQKMDLIKLSKGELKDKNDPRIVSVVHGPINYYNNLIEYFNNAQNAELPKIEQKTNPLANNNEQIKDDNGVLDNDKKKDSISTEFRAENQEFLSDINSNIGGIITPEIMEGLLKRASYSFKDLYEGRLKTEIVDRLELLDVPEENREVEAQKFFLYLRMEKNISMIKSHAINGEVLSNLLDDTALEYKKGFNFWEEHIGDGLTYNELKKLMKEHVEGLDQMQESQNNLPEEDKKLPKDNEKLPEDDKKLPIDDEKIPEEELPNDGAETETQKEVLDFATKFSKLLNDLAEVDAESERLDIKIAEMEEQNAKQQQETIKAKEAEEVARKGAIEAKEAEQAAKKALEEAKAREQAAKKALEEAKAAEEAAIKAAKEAKAVEEIARKATEGAKVVEEAARKVTNNAIKQEEKSNKALEEEKNKKEQLTKRKKDLEDLKSKIDEIFN